MEGDELTKVESMVHSMTRQERGDPELIDKSRTARIARGSGRKQKEVRDLVGRFIQMREMMGQLGSSGMLGKIPGMGSLAGAGGPDLDPAALLGGAGGGGGGSRPGKRTGQQRKKKRKAARKARKKGRRR